MSATNAKNPHEEGVKFLKKAESCKNPSTGLITRLLGGGRPDYDSAASNYEKAALAFRKTSPEMAREAYENAAECQLNNNQLFHSAKSCQQVASLYKELGDIKKCLEWMSKAVARYREYGAPETAASTLLQAAKIAEASQPEEAVRKYKEAAEVYENEDNLNQTADVLREIPRLLLRQNKKDDAVVALQREIDYNLRCGDKSRLPLVNRLVVCMVILQLARSDRNAARSKLSTASATYPEFSESNEEGTLNDLINSFDQGNRQRAEEVLNQPLFKYVDNEFSKLARDLRTSPPEGLYSEELDEDDLR